MYMDNALAFGVSDLKKMQHQFCKLNEQGEVLLQVTHKNDCISLTENNTKFNANKEVCVIFFTLW